MRSRFFVFRRLVLAVLLPGVLLVPLAAGQPRAQKGTGGITSPTTTTATPWR